MRAKTVFLALCILLIALTSDSGLFAGGTETAECVVAADGESCVNPEAAAAEADAGQTQQRVVEEDKQEEVQEVVETQVDAEEAQVVEETADAAEPEADPAEEEAIHSQVKPETTMEEPPEEAQEPELEHSTEKEPEEVEESEEAPAAVEEIATSDATPESVEQEEEEENAPSCPSRKHIIKCAAQYLDTNNNSYLERSELQAAIDSLPWWSRGLLNILGSVDKMMAKCDKDQDDAIGIDYDMHHNSETCLATCFKRRAFKAAFFPDCKA